MKIAKTLLQSALLISAISICPAQASWNIHQVEYICHEQGFTYVKNQERGELLMIANELMQNPNDPYDKCFEAFCWRPLSGRTSSARVHDVVLNVVRNNLNTYPEGEIYWSCFNPEKLGFAAASIFVYARQEKIDWATKVNDSIWQTLIDEKVVEGRK